MRTLTATFGMSSKQLDLFHSSFCFRLKANCCDPAHILAMKELGTGKVKPLFPPTARCLGPCPVCPPPGAPGWGNFMLNLQHEHIYLNNWMKAWCFNTCLLACIKCSISSFLPVQCQTHLSLPTPPSHLLAAPAQAAALGAGAGGACGAHGDWRSHAVDAEVWRGDDKEKPQ